jgi:hypothetical protein
MEELNNFFIGVEEALRWPGYIPLVSTITGFVRILAHKFIQGLVGFALVIAGMTIGVGAQIFGQKQAAQRWLKVASFGVYQCVHAGLNVWRGLVEMIPIVGNIAVYFYDKAMKRRQLIPYPKPLTAKKK